MSDFIPIGDEGVTTIVGVGFGDGGFGEGPFGGSTTLVINPQLTQWTEINTP